MPRSTTRPRWAALLSATLVTSLAIVAPATQTQDAAALDNGLAETPPMGWNSWNQVRCYGLTEDVVKAAADAMSTKAMKDAGYEYVVVDDCFQGGRDADGKIFSHPTRFPSGMKALGDYIHSLGLKFGIYGSPGTRTCAQIWDAYPISGLGSLGHEQLDADTWAEWGVDYVKYDWCDAQDDGVEKVAGFTTMRDAIAKTGRPMVYAISEYGEDEPWTWGSDVSNMWRTTHDIAPTWASVSGIIDAQADLYPHAGPGAWNDPDMLQVGNGSLTLSENQAHVGMWAMLAAPLMVGTDLQKIDPAVLDILTNEIIVGIDQDPLGKQARRLSNQDGAQVWARQLSDGRFAVALYNTSSAPKAIATTVQSIGGSGAYTLTSAWQGKAIANTAGSISATVASHGAEILLLTPGSTPGIPTLLGVEGSAEVARGGSSELQVKVANPGTEPIVGAELTLDAPDGFTVPTGPVALPSIPAGSSVSVAVPVSAASTVLVGTVNATATVSHGSSSSAGPVQIKVPIPDEVYVSDMSWLSVSNGYGPLERDRAVGEYLTL